MFVLHLPAQTQFIKLNPICFPPISVTLCSLGAHYLKTGVKEGMLNSRSVSIKDVEQPAKCQYNTRRAKGCRCVCATHE